MYWYIFVTSLCTIYVCTLMVYCVYCPCCCCWAGIPSVADLTSIYCRCRGIPSSLPELNFYLALSVFKMAGIAQVCLCWYYRIQMKFNASLDWYDLTQWTPFFTRVSMLDIFWVMPAHPRQICLASVWSPWLRLLCSLCKGWLQLSDWYGLMHWYQVNKTWYNELVCWCKRRLSKFLFVVGRKTNQFHLPPKVSTSSSWNEAVSSCVWHSLLDVFKPPDVVFASLPVGPTEHTLFLQTAKGQAVLQEVKDFMRQYILPAQEVSTKIW